MYLLYINPFCLFESLLTKLLLLTLDVTNFGFILCFSQKLLKSDSIDSNLIIFDFLCKYLCCGKNITALLSCNNSKNSLKEFSLYDQNDYT